MGAMRGFSGMLAVVAAFWVVGSIEASGLQFPLAGNERINQFGSGPGTPYNTDPGGVDYDQIGSTDPHPGELLMSGSVPSLNYNTGGGNINQSFATPLDFTLEAELLSAALTPAGGTFLTLTLEFGTTADGVFDLVLTDPTDPGTVLINANLVAGTLNGNPVAAITARATFDCGAALGSPCTSPPVPENVTMQTFAFFDVVSGAYASLFDDGLGGFDAALSPGAVKDFDVGDVDLNFDWNDIVAAFDGTEGSLISSTSEANGSIFSVSGSAFQPVPEPTTAIFLGIGLAGLGLLGTKSTRRR